jgi:hypothetical protein
MKIKSCPIRLILVPTMALTTRPVVGIDHDRVGTARTGAGAVGTDHATTRCYRVRPIARWHTLIGPYFQFEFKTSRLN